MKLYKQQIRARDAQMLSREMKQKEISKSAYIEFQEKTKHQLLNLAEWQRMDAEYDRQVRSHLATLDQK